MKTYITLCLILILLLAANTSAQSAKKTRRSNPQPSVSISSDFSKFVGEWEFIPDPSNGTGIFGKGYFKVIEQQPQRFKFIEGTEYQGNITWIEATVNNADGIYLKPLNDKLTTRFTSPNFRATHGYDLTYRVTLSPISNGKLLYSVCIASDCEKYYATKINNGENTGDVITSNDQAINQSKVKPTNSSFSHIDSEFRIVLQNWLANKPGWRPATKQDAYIEVDKNAYEFVDGEMQSMKHHPYYVADDFNGDGDKDFAVVLTKKVGRTYKYAVAIFNGSFGKNQKVSPTFYTEEIGIGDWLFWIKGDEFGNRIIVGPPASDSGYIIRPKGKRYVIE